MNLETGKPLIEPGLGGDFVCWPEPVPMGPNQAELKGVTWGCCHVRPPLGGLSAGSVDHWENRLAGWGNSACLI